MGEAPRRPSVWGPAPGGQLRRHRGPSTDIQLAIDASKGLLHRLACKTKLQRDLEIVAAPRGQTRNLPFARRKSGGWGVFRDRGGLGDARKSGGNETTEDGRLAQPSAVEGSILRTSADRQHPGETAARSEQGSREVMVDPQAPAVLRDHGKRGPLFITIDLAAVCRRGSRDGLRKHIIVRTPIACPFLEVDFAESKDRPSLDFPLVIEQDRARKVRSKSLSRPVERDSRDIVACPAMGEPRQEPLESSVHERPSSPRTVPRNPDPVKGRTRLDARANSPAKPWRKSTWIHPCGSTSAAFRSGTIARVQPARIQE